MDRKSIGSDCFHPVNTNGGAVRQDGLESFLIRFRTHILMSAPTGGAWAGRPREHKGVLAVMPIVPLDGDDAGLAVYGHIFRMEFDQIFHTCACTDDLPAGLAFSLRIKISELL